MRKHNRPNRIVEIWWTQYKLVKVVDKYARDIHHIIGKRFKDTYNVDIEQNKKEVYRQDHVDYNTFVKDQQAPREAMQKMFEFCRDVLTEETQRRLVEILYNTGDSEFYIPEILKWTKKKKGTTNTATTQTNANTI